MLKHSYIAPDLFSQPIETYSPINKEKLSGQNRRLLDWLEAGNKITCMSPEMQTLRIGYLNSRISDLRHKHGIDIKDSYVKIEYNGETTTVKQYWI